MAFSRFTPGRSLPNTLRKAALRCVIRQSFVPMGLSVSHASSRIPGIAPMNPSGRHADHRHRVPGNLNGLAHDRRVCAIARLP